MTPRVLSKCELTMMMMMMMMLGGGSLENYSTLRCAYQYSFSIPGRVNAGVVVVVKVEVKAEVKTEVLDLPPRYLPR